MAKIKISIITVTYNSQKYLEETILSVLTQNYPHIEYIIIDGGSTDKTLDIINRYRDKIAFFLSEPDENMYDAINKGLNSVTGDYVGILNSDDYYVNTNVIGDIVSYLETATNCQGIYGNLIKVAADNTKIRNRKGFQVSFKELLLSKKLSVVGHGTVFLSKYCISQVGVYDCLNFQYAADYDYILRCFNKFNIEYINKDIFNFREHSESITSSGKIKSENDFILDKNGYYNYSKIERIIVYYYIWIKFMICNFKNLQNRLWKF